MTQQHCNHGAEHHLSLASTQGSPAGLSAYKLLHFYPVIYYVYVHIHMSLLLYISYPLALMVLTHYPTKF